MAGSGARPPVRDRLLDAAEELFYEQGIAATGVDAVLRRAQVAPATLYAHFGGKDQLVAAYLQRRYERWRATWDDALARCGDDASARALSVFDALEQLDARRRWTRGCAFLAAAVEVTDADHPAHRWLEADGRLLTGRLGDLARATTAPDPDALAAELLLLYDGALAARSRRSIDPTTAGEASPVRDLAAAALARHTVGTRPTPTTRPRTQAR